MRARGPRRSGLPDATYVELVRSLFITLAPTSLMSILFVVVASMAVGGHPDGLLAIFGVLGGAVSLARVVVTVVFARRVVATDLHVSAAIEAERVFAATYLAFAVLLGLFGARVLQIADAEMQTVVATLVVGYAAGVAAGVSLRPWISIPAVLLAVVPVALSAAITGDATHLVLAFVLSALLAGGIGSMLSRYRSAAEKIGMRQLFASLARTDHLTGLANRLALAEAFEQEVAARGPDTVAIHCLDLDRFKPVNDQFGHPAGDQLLVEVATRLRSVARDGDVVARLGGDEFALLQARVGHPDEVDLMARRVVRALSVPYEIDSHRIVIGVSLGHAIPDGCGHGLQQLLGCADRALYCIKREGGGAVGHARPTTAATA